MRETQAADFRIENEFTSSGKREGQTRSPRYPERATDAARAEVVTLCSARERTRHAANARFATTAREVAAVRETAIPVIQG